MEAESENDAQIADAIRGNDVAALFKCLRGQKDVEHAGGVTNLMLCARYNRPYFVKYFMHETGRKSALGESALMFAARFNAVQVVRLLRAAEMNLTDANGWSALMHAAHHQNAACVRLLTDEQGLTSNSRVGRFPAGVCALAIAAFQADAQIMQLLARESSLINTQTIQAVSDDGQGREAAEILFQLKSSGIQAKRNGIFQFERRGLKFDEFNEELQETLVPQSPVYMKTPERAAVFQTLVKAEGTKNSDLAQKDTQANEATCTLERTPAKQTEMRLKVRCQEEKPRASTPIPLSNDFVAKNLDYLSKIRISEVVKAKNLTVEQKQQYLAEIQVFPAQQYAQMRNSAKAVGKPGTSSPDVLPSIKVDSGVQTAELNRFSKPWLGYWLCVTAFCFFSSCIIELYVVVFSRAE